MQVFQACKNITISGDEFTSGFLGLHWFPSANSSANKSHYENDVVAGLTRLVKTYIGWCVINEIFFLSTRKMLIIPYKPTPTGGAFNATATADDLRAATMKDTTALSGTGQLPAPDDRVVGTGTGSDTTIRFSPSIFAGVAGAPTGPGATPDEILLHEMLHGLRHMMGRAVKEGVVGSPGMDNYEEFAAIVVSNMFRSERGLTQLRKDHHGFIPLTGTLASTAGFKSAFSSYLTYMSMEQPRFCHNLRQAGLAFNPFI